MSVFQSRDISESINAKASLLHWLLYCPWEDCAHALGHDHTMLSDIFCPFCTFDFSDNFIFVTELPSQSMSSTDAGNTILIQNESACRDDGGRVVRRKALLDGYQDARVYQWFLCWVVLSRVLYGEEYFEILQLKIPLEFTTQAMNGLVPKQTVVLHRRRGETRKCGIKTRSNSSKRRASAPNVQLLMEWYR